jgi:hypothetical protein
MSFDLAVFRPKKALDAAAAGAIYAALTSEGASAPAELVRAKELVAFYEALTGIRRSTTSPTRARSRSRSSGARTRW